jgi:hypothetical protein
MKVQPKTEQECSNLLPAGVYSFEVLEATEGKSKKSNDMITLKLGIEHNESTRGIFDYLVDIDSMAFKIRHFADAVNMLAEYEKGQLNADDLVGLSGKCKLDIQPAQNGYDAKNVVKDYVKRGEASAPAKKAEEGMDDPIPW